MSSNLKRYRYPVLAAMMRVAAFACLLLASRAALATTVVVVHSPANEVTVGTSVNYVASASTSTCHMGIAAMGVYLDKKLVYYKHGNSIVATIPVKAGKHKTAVEAWDYCGVSASIARNITTTNQPAVNLATPSNNSFVSSPVNFVATGTTACTSGVSAMGIFVNGELVYAASGANLNTQVVIPPGVVNATIEEWDKCGGSSTTATEFIVQGAPGQGTVISNVQASAGWASYAEFPPTYAICSTNCTGIVWSMEQNIAPPLPSLSGNATEFDISGTASYGDVLWTNPVLGQFSTQGLPDNSHTLLPTLHNFTYDADFFVTNIAVTQVLEFDISMYMGPVGMIWGTQCNNIGGQVWDIWDNVNGQWISTGVPCNLINNGWNHVTIQAQREPGNTLLYESITLNGSTAILNATYPPFTVPASWWGITLNYQMDGNKAMSSNTTYLDNLTYTFW